MAMYYDEYGRPSNFNEMGVPMNGKLRQAYRKTSPRTSSLRNGYNPQAAQQPEVVVKEVPVVTGVDLSNPTYSNGSQPYMDIYNQLKKSLELQRDNDFKTMQTTRDEDIAKSNAGYDNTARQNYVNYMQAQKRLPNELNALGIRGGASESSLIRLGTNYGSNVAANESARQGALNDIRSAYAKQVADYNKGLNERLAEAESTARENQINYEREKQEKDLEYFSGAIEGMFATKEGYQNFINQLAASNDPNKYYKIQLAMKAMNQLAAEEQKKAAASASSGGGGKKSGKSGKSGKSSGKSGKSSGKSGKSSGKSSGGNSKKSTSITAGARAVVDIARNATRKGNGGR